eukprot:Em0002g143a
MLDEVRSKWSRVADGGERWGTLAVCGGRLVWVGGLKDGVMSKEVKELRGGRWSDMPDMLVGCWGSCVLSVSGGGMVVMGGAGDGVRGLNDVQVFDGGTQTWHRGPSLPEPCCRMSAVVHGDLVFVMGGLGMDRAVWCADIRDLVTLCSISVPLFSQSIWRQLPDVPYYFSSVCVGDGVLLAIGGAEENKYGSKKTSSIYGLHGDDKKWKHVGDMPFACSLVDTLLLSDGGLLVVDGDTKQVLRITVQGLAKLFPITPTVKETGKSQKEADERYGEYEGTGIQWIEDWPVLARLTSNILLLKKDPPEQRVSTGVADNPVRAISFSLAVVGGQEEDDWFVVEDDQALLRVVGGTIRDGGVSMATSLDEVVSSFPKMTIHVSSDGAGAVHPDPTPARVNITMDTVQQSRTVSIEEELIHHINHSSDKKKLFGVKWIHFIDSGGQLQYHDILPLFIQKPAVAMFVLNLSEELSHQPTIEYYGADGKPDARPLIITVGTHRDAADRCSESIAEKSQNLKALLDAGSFSYKVLPQTVFCDPQVVLTKVSEIVEYHHKLLYRPAGGVAAKGDLVKFRDHGLLSVELLNKFSKHYTEGLFTPLDLLKLLVSVGGIAMVGGDEGGVYLMPALLPHLDSGQVSKYCQPAFIPNQPFTLEEIVTLVDMFSYIVLHVDEMSIKVCREVRGCVHSVIKRACGILKYQGVQFEDAFMCAGASCTSDAPHLATVVSKKKWKCSIRRHQRGDLCEGQLMWFGTVSVSLDSEPSLQHLMEKVAAVIPSKYEMVGLQLGLTLAQLQAIRPQHQSLEVYHRAFGEIFNEWRRRGSPPYTWRTLTGVLRSASVGEVLLSEHLTSWVTQQ